MTAPLDAAARRALAARLGEGIRQLGEPLPDADALVSWLRGFDPVLDSLHGMLLQHALDDALEKRLFLSLGLLDTAASQNLLIASVLDRRLDSEQRFRAIRALVQGTGPLSEQALTEIGRLLDPVMTLGDEELDTAFVLAVGSMIDERRGNPGIDELQSQLESRLVIASEADRPRVVSALGNTHDPALVERVADYRDAPSPRLRRNVAQAMGQFGDERAGEVLDAMLRTEANASVRATVLHSLGRYSLDRQQTEIVLRDAAASTDEAVRHAAIGALGRQELDDGARQQLKGMLKTETSRRNFQAIVRALHGKPGTGSSPQ